MLTRNARIAMLLALFIAGVAGEAGAQQRRQGPCAEDAKKLCANVQRGQGAIAKCMREHQSELSPACQSEIKTREARARKVRDECKGDVEKFCKGVAPGGGRIVSCLRARETELAPACAEDLKRRRNRRAPVQ